MYVSCHFLSVTFLARFRFNKILKNKHLLIFGIALPNLYPYLMMTRRWQWLCRSCALEGDCGFFNFYLDFVLRFPDFQRISRDDIWYRIVFIASSLSCSPIVSVHQCDAGSSPLCASSACKDLSGHNSSWLACRMSHESRIIIHMPEKNQSPFLSFRMCWLKFTHKVIAAVRLKLF